MIPMHGRLLLKDINALKRKIRRKQVTGPVEHTRTLAKMYPEDFGKVPALPFSQVILDNGVILREFSSSVPVKELVWHIDEKDRHVLVLESDGWCFQMDNELPQKLYKGAKLFIPKMTWHRVIKGRGPFVISIKES